MEMERIKKPRGSIRIIIRLSVMLLALVITVVSIAYSWFFNNTEADVSDIEMSVADAYNLLVKSDEDTDWKKLLKFDFDEDFVLKAVAGDGKNYYSPVRELQKIEDTSVDFGRYGYVTTGYEAIDENSWKSNGIYVYNFSFMIETACDLYIAEESRAMPATDENGNEISPKSDYNDDMSTGGIVGAVRVAFLKWNGEQYELTAIWIPDVTTALVNSDGQYSVMPNSSPENAVFVSVDESGQPVEYTVDVGNTASGSVVQNGITYLWGPIDAAEQAVAISTLTAMEENKFRIVIWLDGNDRECKNALLEGIVALKMSFAVGDTLQAEE